MKGTAAVAEQWLANLELQYICSYIGYCYIWIYRTVLGILSHKSELTVPRVW